jgi:hypothetical protein
MSVGIKAGPFPILPSETKTKIKKEAMRNKGRERIPAKPS